MSKMSNGRPNENELRFIEGVAAVLTPWGVPPVAAQIYGYLLLCGAPASLDQITSSLGISKSTASVATRLLESYRMVRRQREAGTKRALYAAGDTYEAMIAQQNRLLDALAQQFDSGAGIVTAKGASERLKEMAHFYRLMRDAIDDALSRWKQAKRL